MIRTNDERLAYHQALNDIERGVACFFNDYVFSRVKQVIETCRGVVSLPSEITEEIGK